VSILYTIVIMVLSVIKAGDLPNVLGGLAFLFMLASIVCLYVGAVRFRDKNKEQISRWVGLAVPGISVVIWIFIYGIGMIVN